MDGYMKIGLTLLAVSAAACLGVQQRWRGSMVWYVLASLCSAFAFWAFYLFLKTLQASEPAALFLAAVPFIVCLVVLYREPLGRALSRIGRIKIHDLEIEFQRVSQRIQGELAPTIAFDEAVLSPKQDIAALDRIVSSAIEKMAALPHDKRRLFLLVDFRGQHGVEYYDSAVLYLYVLALREAMSEISAKLVGVLFRRDLEATQGINAIVQTNDYIVTFERTFGGALRNPLLPLLRERLISELPFMGQRSFAMIFDQWRPTLENEPTDIRAFLPKLAKVCRPIEFFQRSDWTRLNKKLPRILARGIDYIVVREGRAIASVVSVDYVAREIARTCAEQIDEADLKEPTSPPKVEDRN